MRASAERAGCGFTLIELLLVVALIGVLASIAIPSTHKYALRARRNEAHINLRGIYTAQKTFQADFGRYGDDFEQIGFQIQGAEVIDPNTVKSKYYTYTLTSIAVNGVEGANFQAIATADLDPGDGILDVLIIENNLTVHE